MTDSPGTPTADAWTLDELMQHLATWGRALELQRERVVAHRERPFEDRTADTRLFAVALRNVVRAASAIADLTDDESIRSVLAQSARATVSRDVRDILDRFDDYGSAKCKCVRDARRFCSAITEPHTARAEAYRVWVSEKHTLDLYRAAEWARGLIAVVNERDIAKG